VVYRLNPLLADHAENAVVEVAEQGREPSREAARDSDETRPSLTLGSFPRTRERTPWPSEPSRRSGEEL
jgi:hypothetical protein